MEYYHIDPQALTVISGPHSDKSGYVKRLTNCGNPELLDLVVFDLVPEVRPVLAADEKYTGGTVVFADRVELGVVKLSAEEQLVMAKIQGEQAVDAFIQAVVDAYNAAHGVVFRDVYSCNIYADKTAYPHQQFCFDVTDWNWRVWAAARAIQADIVAGNRTVPTEAEFLSELPAYTGVV